MSRATKITKRIIDSFPYPSRGQIIYQDSELKGFAVRVTPTKKTFIINKKAKNKLIRHKIATYPELTVEQARVEAQKLLGNIARGVMPKDDASRNRIGAITLHEAFKDYLKAKSLKPKTTQDYENVINTHLSAIKNLLLAEIKRSTVSDIYENLSKKSPALANLCMRVLRAVFNFAKAKYRLSNDEPVFIENPVSIISETKSWKKVKRRTRHITEQELSVWYKALINIPENKKTNIAVTQDYLLFVLFTGLRRNEALSLPWKQVSFRNKTITILNTKNHEDHTLPLPKFLEELLKRRHKENISGSPHVFPSLDNSSHLKEIKTVIATVKKNSGITFSTHDLRRTFITIAESLDIPFLALKRLLNHKEKDVTEGYIISGVERLREPMDKIAERIKDLLFVEDTLE